MEEIAKFLIVGIIVIILLFFLARLLGVHA